MWVEGGRRGLGLSGPSTQSLHLVLLWGADPGLQYRLWPPRAGGRCSHTLRVFFFSGGRCSFSAPGQLGDSGWASQWVLGPAHSFGRALPLATGRKRGGGRRCRPPGDSQVRAQWTGCSHSGPHFISLTCGRLRLPRRAPSCSDTETPGGC